MNATHAPIIRVVGQPRSPGRRSRPVRGIVLLAAAALLAILVAAVSYVRGVPEVRVTPAQRGRIISSITSTATGSVESERDVRVTSQVPGQIAEILTDEGDVVSKGKIMARLDDREALASYRLAQATLQNARANLQRAEVSMQVRGGTADTELERTGAVLEKARADSARASELFAAGVISRSALESSEIEQRVAASSHEASRARAADREVAGSEVAAARALVAQTEAAAEVARVALERARITAPFDGIVSARLVQPGQTIVPSTPLFSLVDREDIHARATFDEVDVGRLATGQHARLLLDSFPGRTFEGVLYEISPTVSTSKQENRTVTGKIRFTGDATGVRPGMSADAEIVVGSSDDALFLPTDVIVQSKGAGGRPSVLVVRAGRVRPQEVETGLSNWDFTQIVSGVSEGDLVVSSLDVPGLTPGARVRIAQAPPAASPR